MESYLELIDSSARVAQAHEILVAVQVDAARTRDRAIGGTASALIDATERVAKGLEAAEITVLGALWARRSVSRVMRTASPDTTAVSESAAGWRRERQGGQRGQRWVGRRAGGGGATTQGSARSTPPTGSAAGPGSRSHRCSWTRCWGRASVVRTVSVTFEPIAPDRSTRDVEAAVTRDRADRELRRRFGQSETARQRQAQEAAVRREAELAAGHGEVRLAGFVTVSGRDPDRAAAGCARRCSSTPPARGLELHRMYGQQADAFHLHTAAGPGVCDEHRAGASGRRIVSQRGHAQAIYPFTAAGGLGGRGRVDRPRREAAQRWLRPADALRQRRA